MDIHFVNMTEKEFLSKKFLRKYMPLEYALKTLKGKKLWFSNPSVWKDPFEKRFIEAQYEAGGKKNLEFPWKDKVFCFCLTGTMECEAYWKLYPHDQIGIKFVIYRNKLLEELRRYTQLYDIYIGKVEYKKNTDFLKSISRIPFDPPIPIPSIDNDDTCARLLLLKRKAFEYEDEVRIMAVKKKIDKKNGFRLKYSCDNTELIKLIILDPSLMTETAKLLKEYFESHYGYKNIRNGDKNQPRVVKSKVYTKQKTGIIKI